IQWNLLSWSSGQRGPSHTVIVPVQVSPLPFVVLSLLLQAANKPITITPVRKRLSHLFISLPPYVTLFDKHPLPSTYHLFVLLSSPLSILIPLHLFHYKAIFPMMTEERAPVAEGRLFGRLLMHWYPSNAKTIASFASAGIPNSSVLPNFM